MDVEVQYSFQSSLSTSQPLSLTKLLGTGHQKESLSQKIQCILACPMNAQRTLLETRTRRWKLKGDTASRTDKSTLLSHKNMDRGGMTVFPTEGHQISTLRTSSGCMIYYIKDSRQWKANAMTPAEGLRKGRHPDLTKLENRWYDGKLQTWEGGRMIGGNNQWGRHESNGSMKIPITIEW